MRRGLLFTGLALNLVGCATLQAPETRATERLLSAAGFRMMAADTPERVAHLQELPQRKIVRRERNGEAAYFYADRNLCNCLYAGTEQQYQEYQRLARQQTIANEAAVVDEEASDSLRWGFWGFWP
jgi:hypothetical protein